MAAPFDLIGRTAIVTAYTRGVVLPVDGGWLAR